MKIRPIEIVRSDLSATIAKEDEEYLSEIKDLIEPQIEWAREQYGDRYFLHQYNQMLQRIKQISEAIDKVHEQIANSAIIFLEDIMNDYYKSNFASLTQMGIFLNQKKNPSKQDVQLRIGLISIGKHESKNIINNYKRLFSKTFMYLTIINIVETEEIPNQLKYFSGYSSIIFDDESQKPNLKIYQIYLRKKGSDQLKISSPEFIHLMNMHIFPYLRSQRFDLLMFDYDFSFAEDLNQNTILKSYALAYTIQMLKDISRDKILVIYHIKWLKQSIQQDSDTIKEEEGKQNQIINDNIQLNQSIQNMNQKNEDIQTMEIEKSQQNSTSNMQNESKSTTQKRKYTKKKQEENKPKNKLQEKDQIQKSVAMVRYSQEYSPIIYESIKMTLLALSAFFNYKIVIEQKQSHFKFHPSLQFCEHIAQEMKKFLRQFNKIRDYNFISQARNQLVQQQYQKYINSFCKSEAQGSEYDSKNQKSYFSSHSNKDNENNLISSKQIDQSGNLNNNNNNISNGKKLLYQPNIFKSIIENYILGDQPKNKTKSNTIENKKKNTNNLLIENNLEYYYQNNNIQQIKTDGSTRYAKVDESLSKDTLEQLINMLHNNKEQQLFQIFKDKVQDQNSYDNIAQQGTSQKSILTLKNNRENIMEFINKQQIITNNNASLNNIQISSLLENDLFKKSNNNQIQTKQQQIGQQSQTTNPFYSNSLFNMKQNMVSESNSQVHDSFNTINGNGNNITTQIIDEENEKIQTQNIHNDSIIPQNNKNMKQYQEVESPKLSIYDGLKINNTKQMSEIFQINKLSEEDYYQYIREYTELKKVNKFKGIVKTQYFDSVYHLHWQKICKLQISNFQDYGTKMFYYNENAQYLVQYYLPLKKSVINKESITQENQNDNSDNNKINEEESQIIQNQFKIEDVNYEYRMVIYFFNVQRKNEYKNFVLTQITGRDSDIQLFQCDNIDFIQKTLSFNLIADCDEKQQQRIKIQEQIKNAKQTIDKQKYMIDQLLRAQTQSQTKSIKEDDKNKNQTLSTQTTKTTKDSNKHEEDQKKQSSQLNEMKNRIIDINKKLVVLEKQLMQIEVEIKEIHSKQIDFSSLCITESTIVETEQYIFKFFGKIKNIRQIEHSAIKLETSLIMKIQKFSVDRIIQNNYQIEIVKTQSNQQLLFIPKELLQSQDKKQNSQVQLQPQSNIAQINNQLNQQSTASQNVQTKNKDNNKPTKNPKQEILILEKEQEKEKQIQIENEINNNTNQDNINDRQKLIQKTNALLLLNHNSNKIVQKLNIDDNVYLAKDLLNDKLLDIQQISNPKKQVKPKQQIESYKLFHDLLYPKEQSSNLIVKSHKNQLSNPATITDQSILQEFNLDKDQGRSSKLSEQVQLLSYYEKLKEQQQTQTQPQLLVSQQNPAEQQQLEQQENQQQQQEQSQLQQLQQSELQKQQELKQQQQQQEQQQQKFQQQQEQQQQQQQQQQEQQQNQKQLQLQKQEQQSKQQEQQKLQQNQLQLQQQKEQSKQQQKQNNNPQIQVQNQKPQQMQNQNSQSQVKLRGRYGATGFYTKNYIYIANGMSAFNLEETNMIVFSYNQQNNLNLQKELLHRNNNTSSLNGNKEQIDSQSLISKQNLETKQYITSPNKLQDINENNKTESLIQETKEEKIEDLSLYFCVQKFMLGKYQTRGGLGTIMIPFLLQDKLKQSQYQLQQKNIQPTEQKRYLSYEEKLSLHDKSDKIVFVSFQGEAYECKLSKQSIKLQYYNQYTKLILGEKTIPLMNAINIIEQQQNSVSYLIDLQQFFSTAYQHFFKIANRNNHLNEGIYEQNDKYFYCLVVQDTRQTQQFIQITIDIFQISKIFNQNIEDTSLEKCITIQIISKPAHI